MGPEPADRLEAMIMEQLALQHKLGAVRDEMSVTERIEGIRIMVLAATAELHEALDETGWKPWATSKHINEEAAFGELRDAWQFLTNAMLLVTMNDPAHLTQRLYDALMDKLSVNYDRIDQRYDGITGKCKQCKRALDDPANLREVPATSTPRVDLHCVCGAYIGSRVV